MSVGKHPKRVANDAGNHEVARRADAIRFENGGETVPDMVVDATIYNLDTVPPGCLCQIDNCLGQQKIIAVTHRFPNCSPPHTQISSACRVAESVNSTRSTITPRREDGGRRGSGYERARGRVW